MKSKRMKKFALFSTVFALYGCVNASPVEVTFKNNTVRKETASAVIALPEAPFNETDEIAKAAFLGSDPNIRSMNAVVLMRDAYGVVKTKSDILSISSSIQLKAKETYQKEQEAKRQDEEKARLEKEEAEKKARLEEEAKKSKGSFDARITTYGVDCYGCGGEVDGNGGTSVGVSLDANAGVLLPNGVWQPGIKFGSYYIVAADPNIPLCSTLKISNHGMSGSGIQPNEPFYAIVLDRGGAIKGGILDLYIGLEASGNVVPVQKTVPRVEILQLGQRQGNTCPLP